MAVTEITHDQWIEEAIRRYGESLRNVKFRCPSCGFVQSGADFVALGMSSELAASRAGYSCIGRWSAAAFEAFRGGPGPCNYAGGGLIGINPVAVNFGEKVINYFDFADEPLCKAA